MFCFYWCVFKGMEVVSWDEYRPLVGDQTFQKTPAVNCFCAGEPHVVCGEWATGQCVDAMFAVISNNIKAYQETIYFLVPFVIFCHIVHIVITTTATAANGQGRAMVSPIQLVLGLFSMYAVYDEQQGPTPTCSL